METGRLDDDTIGSMVKHTLPRRLTALLLAGLVCAASTGLALHDPDCPHHAHGAAVQTEALAGSGAPAAGHPGHAVEAHPGTHAAAHHGDAVEDHSTGEHLPGEQDCDCLGFCALAGQIHASTASGAVQLRLLTPAPTVVGGEYVAGRVPAAVPAIQPPATGPPALS